MPDNYSQISTSPDGRRYGWNGSDWIQLPSISPMMAAQSRYFQGQQRQGISPNAQMVQQVAQASAPAPAPPRPAGRPGAISRISEIELGAPTEKGTAVAGPETYTLGEDLRKWQQDPAKYWGLYKQALKGDVGPVAFAKGMVQDPVGTLKQLAAVPQFEQDWQTNNWRGMFGDAVAAALNIWMFKRNVVDPVDTITRTGIRALGRGATEDVVNNMGYQAGAVIKQAMDNLKNSNPTLHATLDAGEMGDIYKATSGQAVADFLSQRPRANLNAQLRALRDSGAMSPGDFRDIAHVTRGFDLAARSARVGITSRPFGYMGAFAVSYILGKMMGTSAARWPLTLGIRFFALPVLDRMIFLLRFSNDPYAVQGAQILQNMMNRRGQGGAAALGQLPPPGGGGGGGGAAGAPAQPPGGPPPGGGGGAAMPPNWPFNQGGGGGGAAPPAQPPGGGPPPGGGGGAIPMPPSSLEGEGGTPATEISAPSTPKPGDPRYPAYLTRYMREHGMSPGGSWDDASGSITMPPSQDEMMSLQGLLDLLKRTSDPQAQEDLVDEYARSAQETATGLSEDDLKQINKAAGPERLFQPAQQEMLNVLDELAQESRAGAKTEADLTNRMNSAKAKMEAAATKARAARAAAAPPPETETVPPWRRPPQPLGPTRELPLPRRAPRAPSGSRPGGGLPWNEMPAAVREAGSDPAIGAGIPLFADEVIPRLAKILRGAIEEDRAKNLNGKFFSGMQELLRAMIGKSRGMTPKLADEIISEALRQAAVSQEPAPVTLDQARARELARLQQMLGKQPPLTPLFGGK